MRLPTDAALLVLDERAAEPLIAVWREERLVVARVARESLPAGADAFCDPDLEAELDAAGVTTIVVVAEAGSTRLEATLRGAVERGYRVFWIGVAGAHAAPSEARAVDVETTIAAARRARDRERWRAARNAAPR